MGRLKTSTYILGALGTFFSSGSLKLRAHHPASEQFPGHASIATQSVFDYGFGRYRHDGIRADVHSWNASGEYAFSPKASIGLRLGLNRVDPASGQAATGMGDMDITLKTRLFERDHGTHWIGGLGFEIPTGKEDTGLGSGHTELSPFVGFMNDRGTFQLHGSLAGIVSLGEDEHGHGAAAKVNFVNPHEETEIRGHLGASFGLGERAYLNGVLAGELPFSSGHSGDLFLDIRPEIGFRINGGWFASIIIQLPLTSERWYAHRATLQIRKSFGL